MTTLKIEAGDQTEDFIQCVTSGLDDATLDKIDINRELAKPSSLASEPITIGVTVTLGTAAIAAVTRLVERWLESQRQLKTLRIVVDAPTDEAKKLLTGLAEKHAQVSLSYSLAKESWGKTVDVDRGKKK
jgi:hypothetical protein